MRVDGAEAVSDAIDGHMLVNLWAIAWQKWPRAIDAWMSRQGWLMGEGALGVSAGAPARTAKEYADLGRAVAQDLDNQRMVFEHEQISTGLMNTVMGTLTWLKKTGSVGDIDGGADDGDQIGSESEPPTKRNRGKTPRGLANEPEAHETPEVKGAQKGSRQKGSRGDVPPRIPQGGPK